MSAQVQAPTVADIATLRAEWEAAGREARELSETLADTHEAIRAGMRGGDRRREGDARAALPALEAETARAAARTAVLRRRLDDAEARERSASQERERAAALAAQAAAEPAVRAAAEAARALVRALAPQARAAVDAVDSAGRAVDEAAAAAAWTRQEIVHSSRAHALVAPFGRELEALRALAVLGEV